MPPASIRRTGAGGSLLKTAPVERALKNAYREVVSIANYEELIDRGVEEGVISAEDGAELKRTQEMVAQVVNVDDFPREAIEPRLRSDKKVA